MNEKLIFDSGKLSEEELNQITGTNGDKSGDNLQDLSEDSSGDFDLSGDWTKRRGNHKIPHNMPLEIQPHVIQESQDLSQIPSKTNNYCSDNLCGVWIPFKYEKYYKLINASVTKREAEEICHSFNRYRDSGSTLAVPQSPEEQWFINRYLFEELKIVKNVWIGQNTDNYRNHSTGKHHGYEPYHNWAKGMPTLTKSCVHIRSPFNAYGDTNHTVGGKWEDVSCYRRNLVLCQKPQDWSQQQIIRIITELKAEVEALKKRKGGSGSTYTPITVSPVTESPYTHNHVTDTPVPDRVPMGFIYIQLPQQLAPKKLWPEFEWTDISNTYAGLFFRVLGGESAGFGQTQLASSPRLAGVKSYGIHGVPVDEMKAEVIDADDKWSNVNYNGFPVGFRVSAHENRPKNTAIKIWKRV